LKKESQELIKLLEQKETTGLFRWEKINERLKNINFMTGVLLNKSIRKEYYKP